MKKQPREHTEQGIMPEDASQAPFTLAHLLGSLDGQYFGCRRKFEDAVCQVVSANIELLPVGFKYGDAVDAAEERNWLKTRSDGSSGVTVVLVEEEVSASQ